MAHFQLKLQQSLAWIDNIWANTKKIKQKLGKRGQEERIQNLQGQNEQQKDRVAECENIGHTG